MPRINQYKDKYLKTDFYKFLLCERKLRKITQKQLADELGVSQQWYGEKEKNADFTFGEMLTIFRVLNTDTKDILKLFGR